MANTTPAEVLRSITAPWDDPEPVPVTLMLVAHPDDEVVGWGARLKRLAPNLNIVHVTDGAPRNMQDARAQGFGTWTDYACARREETLAALSKAGIGPDRFDVIGYPDQEASLNLVEIVHDVAERIRRLSPSAVLTHPYEGGHPDHDAASFAVQAACRLIATEGGRVPVVVEATSYHNENDAVTTGAFLRRAACPEVVVPLSLEDKAFKQALFDCFPTQAEVMRWFTLHEERFRCAPAYDYTKPPHDGTLHYELYGWGMKGERWRKLAREALLQLDLA